MSYTAAAVAFVIICAAVGLRGSGAAARTPLAAALAAAMVAAQFVLLLWR